MRVNLAAMAKHLPLISVIFVLLGTLPANAQTQARLISWQPHTFGRITRAAEGVRLSPVAEALEIVGFTVEGEAITLGEPFAASNEWLKSLKVRVWNISGQTLSRAQMYFVLPESRTEEGRTISLILKYGSIAAETLRLIQPDEEFELSLMEEDYERLNERIAERRNPTIINRLFITLASVQFADGTSWASGCIRATNPKNSCPPSAT